MLSQNSLLEPLTKPSNTGRIRERKRRESRHAMPVSPMPKPPAISTDTQTWLTLSPRLSQSPLPRSTTTTGVCMRVDKNSALQESLISKLSAISTSMRISRPNSELEMMLGSKPRTISIPLDSPREDYSTAREDQLLSALLREDSANVTVTFSTPQCITMDLRLKPQPLPWTSLNPSNGHSDKRTQETIESIAKTVDSEILLQVEQSNAGARLQSQESPNHAVQKVKTADAQHTERFSTVLPLPRRTPTPPSRSSLNLHTL